MLGSTRSIGIGSMTTTTTNTNIIPISISCKYHIHISPGILWWFSKELQCSGGSIIPNPMFTPKPSP